jgi:hypothetical protein
VEEVFPLRTDCGGSLYFREPLLLRYNSSRCSLISESFFSCYVLSAHHHCQEQHAVVKLPEAKHGFVPAFATLSWWSALLLGPHASDGWCAMMSVCPLRWLVFI